MTGLPLTPSQTVGPFLAIGLPWPDGPSVVPEDTPGAITDHRRGLLDGAGEPVPDALVETWQADPDGRFDHPDDPRGRRGGRPAFRGFGRCPTGPDGRYRIVTLRPGPLPSPDGGTEAPHLDVSVFARGLLDRVVTRIYFPDEADGERRPTRCCRRRRPRPPGHADRRGAARAPSGPGGSGSTSACRASRRPSSSMSEPMPGPVRLAATLDGPRDAPVLVLGNSLGTTRDLWEPQLAGAGRALPAAPLRAPRARRLARPARPVHHRRAWARTCCACSDDFGVEHASYCGVSLGGMVGMWLAAHAPERIDALGLCCTSARFPDTGLWVRRAAAVRAGGLPPISAQVVSRWFTPAFAARVSGRSRRRSPPPWTA